MATRKPAKQPASLPTNPELDDLEQLLDGEMTSMPEATAPDAVTPANEEVTAPAEVVTVADLTQEPDLVDEMAAALAELNDVEAAVKPLPEPAEEPKRRRARAAVDRVRKVADGKPKGKSYSTVNRLRDTALELGYILAGMHEQDPKKLTADQVFNLVLEGELVETGEVDQDVDRQNKLDEVRRFFANRDRQYEDLPKFSQWQRDCFTHEHNRMVKTGRTYWGASWNDLNPNLGVEAKELTTIKLPKVTGGRQQVAVAV